MFLVSKNFTLEAWEILHADLQWRSSFFCHHLSTRIALYKGATQVRTFGRDLWFSWMRMYFLRLKSTLRGFPAPEPRSKSTASENTFYLFNHKCKEGGRELVQTSVFGSRNQMALWRFCACNWLAGEASFTNTWKLCCRIFSTCNRSTKFQVPDRTLQYCFGGWNFLTRGFTYSLRTAYRGESWF